MSRNSESYRQEFAGSAQAADYDAGEYAPESYANALWKIEEQQLRTLVDEFRTSRSSRIDYLDFACGTGRVLSIVEGLVGTATGIEISQAMADLAQKKVRRAAILCRDISTQGTPIEGQYDVITAFRFVLNAEPALRTAAIAALAARLRDENSWLIFNNHGNLWSHKLVLWPLHTLRRAGRGYQARGNYLSHREIMKLMRQAGLTVERVLGCGVIGAKLAKLLPFDQVVAWETRLAGSWMSRFGANQMYVVSRRRS